MSEHLRQVTIDVFQPKKDIVVIPNFIDPARFSPEQPQLACRFVPAGRRVLMHVSNFRPVKRVLDVVEIFDRVQKRVPATLVMVGDGPDRPAAEALCREKGIAALVTFLGNMPAVEALMPSADLYLLPTDSESFGLSALEAQACGVPVLGYAVGGLPEVVVHGETGFLRAVGDVGGLADDGASLLQDEPRYTDDVGGLARARRDALQRGRDRLALPRAVRERPRRGVTGRARAARSSPPGRPRGDAPVLAASVVPKIPGSSVESVTGTPAARSSAHGVRRARGTAPVARFDVGQTSQTTPRRARRRSSAGSSAARIRARAARAKDGGGSPRRSPGPPTRPRARRA